MKLGVTFSKFNMWDRSEFWGSHITPGTFFVSEVDRIVSFHSFGMAAFLDAVQECNELEPVNFLTTLCMMYVQMGLLQYMNFITTQRIIYVYKWGFCCIWRFQHQNLWWMYKQGYCSIVRLHNCGRLLLTHYCSVLTIDTISSTFTQTLNLEDD